MTAATPAALALSTEKHEEAQKVEHPHGPVSCGGGAEPGLGLREIRSGGLQLPMEEKVPPRLGPSEPGPFMPVVKADSFCLLWLLPYPEVGWLFTESYYTGIVGAFETAIVLALHMAYGILVP